MTGGGLAQLGELVSTNGTELAILSVVVLVCLAGLVVGIRKAYDAYAIWSNEPIPAGEVHTADAEVEVEGTAEPIAETTDAPYTDTPSVAYRYKKERRKTRADDDGGTERYWGTVASGYDAVPFLVTDDTGEVAIDPADATLEAGTDHRSRSGNIRRTERRLEPGDDVHVYGQRRTANEQAIQQRLGDRRQFIGSGQQVTTFQITQGGEVWAVGRTAGKAALYTVLSTVVGVLTADQLLGLFGVGPFLLT